MTIIIKALNYIIQRPGIVKDEFGMPLILKERNNVYYTTYEVDSEFKDELTLPILTQPGDIEYIHRVSNSLTKKVLCDKKSSKEKIVNLLNTETPVIKELIVENSVVAIEKDSNNKLANIVVEAKTVEGSLLDDENGSIISSIIPGCSRSLKLDLLSPKSDTFCGQKVSWSPPHWQDKVGKTTNFIDDKIKNLLRSTLKAKHTFLGVGSGDNFVILRISVLYPIVDKKRDVNGKPSVENLPRKKDGITIDMRAVPSGRKASSYAGKELREFFAELGVKPTSKKTSSMLKLLEESMKKQKLWIAKTTANLKGKKLDVINLYKDVLS